jgi:hypothetical protein
MLYAPTVVVASNSCRSTVTGPPSGPVCSGLFFNSAANSRFNPSNTSAGTEICRVDASANFRAASCKGESESTADDEGSWKGADRSSGAGAPTMDSCSYDRPA